MPRSIAPRLRRSAAHLAAALGSSRRTALAVVILLGITSVFTFAAPSGTLAWDVDAFSASSEADLVALTNRARANAGLRALQVDATLTSVARWRSKDMIVRDYFSHDIPGYGKVWDKLNAIGYCYKVAGENIGWNNYPDDVATASIQQMFMNSAGHRANILGTGWDVVGIGAYKGPTGKKMWTVLFADKCGTTPAPTPKPTPKPTPRPTPKPTPRPTAKATPRPTPPPAAKPTPRPTVKPATVPAAAPTPTPTPTATTELSLPLFSEDPGDPTLGLPPPSNGATESSLEPTPQPTAVDAGGTTVGMRVIDRGPSDGLLDTIVGGVAGFFFGG